MRAVVQRCFGASVRVGGEVVGEIEGHGVVVLLGVGLDDGPDDVDYLAEKIAGLRIFEDQDGKMNLDLTQVQGKILCISQFTLYGDVRKGRRPNYMKSAPPQQAEPLYEAFNAKLRSLGFTVETGQFGAMMQVTFTNDGPVTILLDSQRMF